MRTNIEIDDKLMKKAMKASGATTKKAAVEAGLELLVKVRAQEGIRKLFGKVEWEGNLEDGRTSDKWNGSPLTWAEDAVLPAKASAVTQDGKRGASRTIAKRAA